MSFQFFPLLKTRYTQLVGPRLVRQYAKVEGSYYEYILNYNYNE